MRGFSIIVFIVVCHTAIAQPLQPLSPAAIDSLITEMQKSYAKVNGYTCTFYKQERVDEEMRPRETILLKFRKPFQIYMRWVEGPYKGRELLYKDRWNDGEVRVKQESFPYLTVNIAPDGALAMRGNRHPVTEAGIGQTVDIIVRDYQRGLSNPADSVRYYPREQETIYGATVYCIEAVMPQDANAGYYAHRAVICISQRTRLPIHVKIWNADNKLVEDYGYADLKINPGLTPRDFAPDNPAYGF